jgi:hypothetical protein
MGEQKAGEIVDGEEEFIPVGSSRGPKRSSSLRYRRSWKAKAGSISTASVKRAPTLRPTTPMRGGSSKRSVSS